MAPGGDDWHQIQLLRDTNMHASTSCKHLVSRRQVGNTHKVRSDGSICIVEHPGAKLNKRHTLDAQRTNVTTFPARSRPLCPHCGDRSLMYKFLAGHSQSRHATGAMRHVSLPSSLKDLQASCSTSSVRPAKAPFRKNAPRTAGTKIGCRRTSERP